MSTTNSAFDRWLFRWRCDYPEGYTHNSPLIDAFEAGQLAAIAAIVVDEPETWHPDCTFRVGVSHRCASRLGHTTPHQMVQTSERGARG
jgi:hypothetical protein